MRRIFTLLLCFCGITAGASHIVGGEFELLHVEGFTYRLNLIIYFDKLNGLSGAKDPSATVSIFRKSNNTFISSVVLPLDNESSVSYTQPECSNGRIVTDKLIYTTLIELDPEIFNESQGYYIAWERCCRNYEITNIFSEDPTLQNGGIAAGQTFYLHFPPVVKEGQPFVNSSPRLFPPLNDYACPGKPYYVDFAGIDDDGDSLVYTMTTPLNTHSATALPPVQPEPYPTVDWRPGFNINHIIDGNPDLRISIDGLLTATPTVQGLFVFAVKIEEYRNKKLIGESRRDFQMLVVDDCADAVAPVIAGPSSVNLTATQTGNDRCITVTVSDGDSQKPNHLFTEKVRIRAVGINFKDKNLTEVLPPDVTATLTNGSTHSFDICFPVCPFFSGGPAEIGIIAMDDACSLPLLDTLKVTVNIEPPPNTNPYFTTLNQDIVLKEGNSSPVLNFEVRDDDADELLVAVVTDGFILKDAGITYIVDNQAPGLVQGHLQWDAFCDIYDFTKRNAFQVKLLVDDLEECNVNEPVFATFNFNVIDLPENTPPIIDTNLTADPAERLVSGLQQRVFGNISFDVTGRDNVDMGQLKLNLLRSDVLNASTPEEFAQLGITFDNKVGIEQISSNFSWDIKCESIDFENIDIVDLEFIVVDDANKCKFVHTDTVEVEVKILPPLNSGPQLAINSLNSEVALVNNQIDIFRGSQIVLSVQGADADLAPQDQIRVEMIDAKGNVLPTGFVFEPVEGLGSAATTFSWNPECSIFENGVYENDYTFTFRVTDGRCFNTMADTVSIDVKIRDVDGSENGFEPNNFFSPDGNGINDYYAMERRNILTGELENSLPADNCISQFQAIRVYDRWGKEVYSSTDRNFKWDGKGEPPGVYFYLIEYSNREYKGALSIRY